MKHKQKDTFVASEGDAWFDRNHEAISRRNYNENDPIIQAVDHCLANAVEDARSEGGVTLLEVGCGEGKRLQWLQENRALQCSGIEPSSKAVELAISRGVEAVMGTADSLPFSDDLFDFVVFGFCLYLCDREDLFKIAYEADRALKKTGWLIIYDFFSSEPISQPYHHLYGINSFKMDYRKLWDWSPGYTCFSHKLSHHSKPYFTDDQSEWVATSILRKNSSKWTNK
jgi:ubiquinone/menaquinone biosynthesis C-methylase UbiE